MVTMKLFRFGCDLSVRDKANYNGNSDDKWVLHFVKIGFSFIQGSEEVVGKWREASCLVESVFPQFDLFESFNWHIFDAFKMTFNERN